MGLPGIDSITSLVTSFLDVQSRRAQIVAGNLANADTPGFVAKELDFSDYLRRAANDAVMPQNSSSPSTNQTDGPRVVEQAASIIPIDGNTVDVGREMSTMAEAGMKYLVGTQLLQSRLRTLRTAIREGR